MSTTKGTWKRPVSKDISEEELDLKYELIKSSTSEERKKEILKRLEEIKMTKLG